MTDHDLGQALRNHVLRERPQALPQPHRLLAVLGDLVSDDQQRLLPALRTLVLSNAFASAIRQEPPLADGRLLPRLQRELATVNAPEVRQRMDAVLAGLLDQPEPASIRLHGSTEPVPGPDTGGRGMGWGIGLLVLSAMLATLSGVAMALVGGGLVLWLRHRGPQPRPDAPSTSTPAALPSTRAIRADPGTTEAPTNGEAALVAATGSPDGALSAQDAVSASRDSGAGSIDPFHPTVVRQSSAGSLSQLRETDRRTFNLDTSRSPAVVMANAVEGILRRRR